MSITSINNTICAICTASGVGSVSIVRLSGKRSKSIAEKIFSKELEKERYMYYGEIKYLNQKIDEGLCVYFGSPNSFTGEDVVEFHLHGGDMIAKNIIDILQDLGCLLAEPGEFSYRAYLNGKMDLIKAEAVSEMINSESSLSLMNSLMNFSGEFRKKYNNIRNLGISLLAEIESRVDFPEEQIPEIDNIKIKRNYEDLKINLHSIINSYDKGLLISKGISLLIIGSPNSGKSTLFNTILDQDKAIVTKIPGTTRDILDKSIVINGIKYNIIDTAGIRETKDPIESIGIAKSLDAVEFADFIILLLDIDKDISSIKKEVDLYMNKLSSVPRGTIFIINNKIDLIESKGFKEKLNLIKNYEKKIKLKSIDISAKKNININKIFKHIEKKIDINSIKSTETLMTSKRQNLLSIEALNYLDKSYQLFTSDMPLEIVAQEIRFFLNKIAEITGEISNNDLYDELFSKFCIGK